MNEEIYEDLFKNVVINGHYPFEKLNEMKYYIKTLNIKIDDLEQQIKKQQEVINKAIKYINSNPNVFYDEYLIDVETLKNNEMTDEIVGEIRFISNLLDILKEVKNE